MSDGTPTPDDETRLYNLRVTVDRIEGRSVCGMRVGDHFDLVDSARLRIPDGQHFCVFALGAVLPLLAAKQRPLASGDWLAIDAEVCCPDPAERLVMRIERTGVCTLATRDVT